MRELVHIKEMPSHPGFLDLTPEQLKRLVRQEPIEKFYEVEEQPFARGKYATVRRCRERSSGRHYAAKFLRKRRRAADLRPEILHEVAVLEACRGSPRVVRLNEVFESTHEMVLLLELACGGELQMLLDRDEVLAEVHVLRLMKQILDGLGFLHDINVAHLDIKPQNLVLTGQFPHCDVKLCDFGISRYLSHGVDVREILGTPDYVAPEVLNYEPISLATDIWSVGVLLYVLLTGCSPFGGDTKQETFCNISQCRLDFPDELFEHVSEEAKDLMTKLMVKVPSERLTLKECLQHPWFALKLSDPATAVPPLSTSYMTPPRTPVPMKRAPPEEKSESFHKVSPIPTLESCRTSQEEELSGMAVKGLSGERRKSFMKSMESLVAKLDSEEKKVTMREKPCELTRIDSFRSMTRASGMQTMPVSGLLRFRQENRSPLERESVFKFRRVFILDDPDTDCPSSPPSIISSLSSDNSSMSDSNSDTVSDMSVDSSSDRSSIISLDDSFDCSYSKGLSHARHYSSCYNVWEAVHSQRVSPGAWPRECSGSFARALSRLTTTPDEIKEGSFHRQRRSLTVFNSNKLLTAPMTTPPGHKCIGLELMRERSGNLVVIREVKAISGSRYARCSEVKCETVQSRIRRLQVKNGFRTELANESRHNVF